MVEYAASQERIAKLERELKEAADQEAETAQRFDRERKRRAALDHQLHQVRGQATSLMLDEASRTRNALLAEAVEFLQATRVEADREAGQVTKQAFEQANEMIAEGVAILDAAREEVRTLEEDAAQQIADLDTEHRKLTHRLGVMEIIQDELQATLKLVRQPSSSSPKARSRNSSTRKITSKRWSRVLSSGSGVEGADPEEVGARIRNLSHGTNGE
jgi:chromosome segregation ATPase